MNYKQGVEAYAVGAFGVVVLYDDVLEMVENLWEVVILVE